MTEVLWRKQVSKTKIRTPDRKDTFLWFRPLLEGSRRIMIVTHANPDGDALTSALALRIILEGMHKHVEFIYAGEVPKRFRWLASQTRSGSQEVMPDLLFVVDCGELGMVGALLKIDKELFRTVPLVNIDHHCSNPRFGHFNFVDDSASSTAQVLIDLFCRMNIQITPQVASLLLTGIIADTESFRYNSSATTLRCAADLIDQGASLFRVHEQLDKRRSPGELGLWKAILAKLEISLGGKALISSVSQDDYTRYCHLMSEVRGEIVNFLLDTKDVVLVLLFQEIREKVIRLSVRATDSFDASLLAARFGGGGHRRAAGCRMSGLSLSEAKTKVISFLETHWDHLQNPELAWPLYPKGG